MIIAGTGEIAFTYACMPAQRSHRSLPHSNFMGGNFSMFHELGLWVGVRMFNIYSTTYQCEANKQCNLLITLLLNKELRWPNMIVGACCNGRIRKKGVKLVTKMIVIHRSKNTSRRPKMRWSNFKVSLTTQRYGRKSAVKETQRFTVERTQG